MKEGGHVIGWAEKHSNWDQPMWPWMKTMGPSSSHIAAAGPPERVAPRAEPTLKRRVSNACSCKMRSSWYRGLLNQCSPLPARHVFIVLLFLGTSPAKEYWSVSVINAVVAFYSSYLGMPEQHSGFSYNWFTVLHSGDICWLLEVASWQDWSTRVEHPATRINGYGFHPVSLNISSSRLVCGSCNSDSVASNMSMFKSWARHEAATNFAMNWTLEDILRSHE